MKLHLTFLRNEGEALMTHSYHVSACYMYSRIQHCSSHLHWVVLQHSTDTQYNLMLSHLRWSLFSAFEKHLLFFLWVLKILPKPCTSLRWHCEQQMEARDWICFYSLSGAQLSSKPAYKKKHILPSQELGAHPQGPLLNRCH